jgi:uncharacterized protein
MLTDTGPLVALVDTKDVNHQRCVDAARGLSPGPLLTSWPCLVEAMHLLGSAGGFPFQEELWKLWERGEITLHDLTPPEMKRMYDLMAKYRDRPMDLADASLLVIAELLGMRRVFTLDSDFRFYTLKDGTVLDIIP